jgi:hypothetical protein
MASIISAGTTDSTSLNVSGDKSGILQLASNNSVTAVTIDTSQNVGISSTPSAWGAGYPTLQVGGGAACLTGRTGTSVMYLGSNWYYDGTNNKYIISDNATQYYQSNGNHVWRYAAGGTAGATISATEAMRIDSSGNLLVGTTSNTNYNSAKLAVNGNIWMDGSSTGAVIGSADNNTGSSYGALSLGASYAAGSVKDITLILQNNAGQRIYVQNRSAGVYLADGGTSWTSNSDERIKKNLVPIEDALNKVSQLRAVIGEYIDDELVRKRPFLIAQDVNNVLPEAVDKTNENVWGVQYTDVIPLLVASIKELKAINDTQATTINALIARIEALENK